MIRTLLVLTLVTVSMAKAQSEIPQGDLRRLTAANDAFALDLLRTQQPVAEDALVSPLSLMLAFGMTWAGSEDEVHRDIARALRFTLPPDRFHRATERLQARLGREATGDPGVMLHIANRLWGDRRGKIEPGFLELTRRAYGAPLERLDFGQAEAARATINAWIADRTARMIPELLPPGSLDSNTALVLTNAVYFKGRWARAFDPEHTRPADWRLSGDQNLRVSMMSRQGEFGLAQGEHASLLELPFAGDEFVMSVILPHEGRSLAELEASLDAGKLHALRRSVKPRTVRVEIPRFALKVSARLHEKGLPQLGMKAPFAFSRDWGPLNGDREPLGISGVYHDTCFVVDEAGAEAAAATGIVMKRWGAPPAFRADRPFLFTLHHKSSGALLFLGRLVRPEAP